MSSSSRASARPSSASRWGVGVTMLVGALVGLLAAFSLTVEKVRQLADPQVAISCDVSLLVQCGKNLASWQGSVLGFPNPVIGLVGWPVVAAVGAAVLAGVVFPRWWWRAVAVGMAGAQGFTVWLQYVSIFELGTLCPWCMVTWAATIPVFVVVWAWTVSAGVWSQRGRVTAAGGWALGWAVPLVAAWYATVAVVAQARLDWLSYL